MPVPMKEVTVLAVLVAVSVLLEGCTLPHVDGYVDVSDATIATHKVPFWRQEEEYWVKSSYVDIETQLPAFNSCMDPRLSALDVCSRRGHCAPFDELDVTHPTFFCKCNRGWGGPECQIEMKSQFSAWTISLLLGPLALDELYLGWTKEAMVKILLTLIGFMIYATNGSHTGLLVIMVPWLFDVVRIGMSPVQAVNFRLADDLPRFTFAGITILYVAFIGFCFGLASAYYVILDRRYNADRARLHHGGGEKVLA